MSDKRYKRQERRVAAYFKTERTPLSGSNSKQTQSDTLHPQLYIECKDRKRHTIFSLYDQTVARAKKEGKHPILCLTEPGRRGFLVCTCSDDFTYDELTSVRLDGFDAHIVQKGLAFTFKKDKPCIPSAPPKNG